MELTLVDVAAFVAFIAAVVGISLYVSRKEDNTEDYFLAGRRLTWGLIGFSLRDVRGGVRARIVPPCPRGGGPPAAPFNTCPFDWKPCGLRSGGLLRAVCGGHGG